MSASTDGAAAARELYLDLLKRTLTGAVYEDNDTILGGVRHQSPANVKQRIAKTLGQLASRFNLEISYKKPYDPQIRAVGRDTPSRAESMIGLRRMENLQHCIESVVADGVPGDLIETGVWRGGATILMSGVLQAYGDTSRSVWVADSFQGLPPPDSARYPADAVKSYSGTLDVGVDQVRRNFQRYGLLTERVQFLVGWFKDTLPTAPIDRLAVLRLDGDMYESTWQAMDALYPKLSAGGYCIVDDYLSFATQCGRAIDDYRKAHDITDEMVTVDQDAVFWRKAA